MENSTQQKVSALILEHTGMSSEQLFDMRVDNAKAYMQDVMQVQESCIIILMESKLFWDWWLSMWYKKDAEFIASCEFGGDRVKYSRVLNIPMLGVTNVYQISFLTQDKFKSTYECIHNPYIIDVFPHNKIVEDSYMKMTHKLIKEAVAPAYKSV